MRDLRNRPALLALATTGLVAAAVRVPWVTAGIGPDEGGYAYLARQWSHGADLYQDLWVDRPQGLLSVYRAIVTIADHAWAIRLTALLVGVGITLTVGAIGWMLRSPATGVAAAAIFAVVGVGPHIEGFTLSGELLAALPAAAAVAAAVRWWRTGRERWLFTAGVLGGGAMLMKQSGFDGLAAAFALAVVASGSVRARLRSGALVVAGSLVPFGAALLQALTVGLGTYWSDVVAYRAGSSLNGHFGTRAENFEWSFPKARADLVVVAVLALAGLVALGRRRARRTELVVVGVWLAAALAAFNIGGSYWPHYYVQLVPPLALLAGIAVTAVRYRVLAVALACGAVAPVCVTLAQIASDTPEQRDWALKYERGYEIDQALARFVDAHTKPSDTVYALSSRADLYFLANRRAAIPFLWHHSPLDSPRGLRTLRHVLTGPHPPRYVVVFQRARTFDYSGRLTRILRHDYREVWRGPARIPVLAPRPDRLRPNALG